MNMLTSPEFSDIVQAALALGKQVASSGAKITTAESCTGGLIATALTQVGGSSDWFDRGFVTYSNDAKEESLGVANELLNEFGAVSEPVARAMALGALQQSKAMLALAVTGVAGPSGGSLLKPVGTVWFGWAISTKDGNHVESQCLLLPGDRAAVRNKTALHSLLRAAQIWRSVSTNHSS